MLYIFVKISLIKTMLLIYNNLSLNVITFNEKKKTAYYLIEKSLTKYFCLSSDMQI